MADASSSNPRDMQIPEVHWEEPRRHMQDEDYYKLILTGKEDIITVIKSRLEEFGQDAEAAMDKSVFKHFMRYPKVISKSGKCIHHLISREARGTPNPDPTAIFFRVNGKVVKFGRMEFALVTGLRFGPSRFDPFAQHQIPENSLYTRAFNNTPTSPNNLWYWYQIGINWEGLDSDDCVNLSQILIVAHIIMGMDGSSTKIPDWVWVLVEDKKEWSRFPWGSISYQLLVNALRSVKDCMSANSYHLTGNTLAFMGWIYEAFPDLGRDFGGRVRRNCRPRGLRYTYSKGLTYDDIDITEIIPRLEPDHKEVGRSYVKLLEPEGTPFSLIYNSQLERASRAGRRAAQRVLPPVPPRRADIPPESSSAGEQRGERARTGACNEEEAPYTLTASKKRMLVQEIAEETAKRARQEIEGSSVFAQKVADIVVSRITGLFFPDRQQNWCNDDDGRAAHMSEDRAHMSEDRVEGTEGEGENADGGGHGDDTADKVVCEEAEKDVEEEGEKADEEAPHEGEIADEEAPHEGEKADEEALHEGEKADQEAPHEGEKSDGLDTDPIVTPCTAQMEKELAEILAFQKQVFHEEMMNDEIPFSTPQGTTNPGTSTTSNVEAEEKEEEKEEDEDIQTKGKQVVLYTRAPRKRKRAAALRSPFLPNDVRGRDYAKFMRGTGASERNVGLPYPVGKEYFQNIKQLGFQLENEHIEPYLSILATAPIIAGINNVKKRIRITGSSFYQAILEAWIDIEKERVGSVRFDEEEEVKEEELKRLSMFVDGRLPKWGALDSWEGADQVIMVCCFNQHWATCILDLRMCTLEIWDSNQWKFEKHHLQVRSAAFEPVARIVPQVLKYMKFYATRSDVVPIYTQWEHIIPKHNVIKQTDSASCGPLALLYAENRLKGVPDKKMTRNDIQNYRNHIAKSIYEFSTDGSTISQEG